MADLEVDFATLTLAVGALRECSTEAESLALGTRFLVREELGMDGSPVGNATAQMITDWFHGLEVLAGAQAALAEWLFAAAGEYGRLETELARRARS